jgi:hypothetical protein
MKEIIKHTNAPGFTQLKGLGKVTKFIFQSRSKTLTQFRGTAAEITFSDLSYTNCGV